LKGGNPLYKHGVVGQIVPSQEVLPPSGVGTLAVFVGTAPIHELADPIAAIDKAYLVNSFDEAKSVLGYSDDWDSFTLCEVMKAFFQNGIANIGPVVMINVLDPAVHTDSGTATVTLVDSVGYINESIILDSVAITDAVLGTDFKVERDGERVKLTALTGKVTSPVDVAFDKVDVSKVTSSDVVGEITASGERTGLANVDLIYQDFGLQPTLLAAPGWSDQKDVYDGLVAKAQKVNSHWDATILVDLPVDATADTIEEVLAWKETNGRSSLLAKVCWPLFNVGPDIYRASTMAAWRMVQTDFENDNVPYVSPSNQPLPITGCTVAGGQVIKFDEVQANLLNAKGITTAAFVGGKWRLWGPHNGNYSYGADIKPEDLFDCSIRMMRYITNTFQANYMSEVDGPMDRRKIESIIDSARLWLNSLKAEGKVLLGEIAFLPTSNPTASLIEGDFVFDIKTTTTPPGKSLTFKLQYTSKGIATLFGGEA